MKTVYITEAGRINLENKILNMVAEIKQIQEEKNVAYHISGDGWHDNPGYNQLEQKEHRTVEEMVKLKQHLAKAIVYKPKAELADQIQIGSNVKMTQKALKGGKAMQLEWRIVGSGESDIKRKKIAYDSPIGASIMHKKAGDTLEVQLPAGIFRIELQEVRLLG